MLLTPTETVTTRIAADAGALASHLRNAIVLANRITDHALDLPTAELNEWLNARPLEQRLFEFSDHGIVGDALNEAAATCELVVGVPDGSIGRVDIRSVADKLAAQGRTLEIVDGAFVVSQLPQPESAPVPESESESEPESLPE